MSNYKNAEILAPAGSPEILKAVINAGADAIYVGGYKFGARAYATNFDEENLLWAIDYAHLNGKKLYLTVNTLLKSRELEQELFDYIKPLYEAGLDAVLVQDIGVLHFLKRNFPALPLHASTQFTITSVESARYLKSLGVERAVLSRELSLDEIKEIHSQVDIELEAFVHGALCYSFSGMCLFSSMLGGRSGNRGRCAQPCRLQYSVMDGDNKLSTSYILSLKDMCGINQIQQLIDAGIYSLKIEGRMKQAEYAYQVTKAYASGKSDENTLSILKDCGNRGGFTNSYLYHRNDSAMITYQDSSLHKNEKQIQVDLNEKKRKITGALYLHKGAEAMFLVSDSVSDKTVCVNGQIVEAAKNAPLQTEDVEIRMQKTNDTPFEFSEISVEMDPDIFVPNGALNQLRREALNQLLELILQDYRRNSADIIANASNHSSSIEGTESNSNITVAVSLESTSESMNHLELILEQELVHRIDLPLTAYHTNSWTQNMVRDINLCKEKGKLCYLALPTVLRNSKIKEIEANADFFMTLPIDGFVVNSFDAYAFCIRVFPGMSLVSDSGLYTFNNEAVHALSDTLVSICAPLELNHKELSHRDNQKGEILLYGRYPLMHAANCVCKNTKGCVKKQGVLSLEDRYKAKFPVINHCNDCYNTIYNSLPTNLISEYHNLRNMGFQTFKFAFTTESKEEIKKVLMDFRQGMMDNKMTQSKGNYTKGHYNRGVE